MKVQEIMSRGVVWVEPETTILQAAQKMRDLDVGFLAICENDRLVGTLTDRDIAIRSVAQGRDPREAPVREIMSADVFCGYADDDIERVSEYMQEKEVRRLLILDGDKRLVGVVSLGDIAKISGDQLLAGETLGHIAEAA
jgi:CBS domain-containing protein